MLGGALTWWNSYVRTVRYDAAYGMPWKTLMKMMTENYFPRSKIKKLATEMWNFVKKDESDKVEKYTGGLPDSIQGCVMASKPKMLQEAIELTRSLMDQKLRTHATRQAENKRKMDNNSRSNHAEESPYKRQNVARAYFVRPGEKREYAGTLPLCNKCKFPHNGSCATKCTNCKRVGHLARDCRSPDAVNTQRAPRTVQKTARNGEAHGRAYALGGGEPNNDSNVVTGDFSKKFYNSIGRVPNHYSSSIGKTRGLLSFSRGIGWECLITV
ncbi:putative reverse transcriptase domain-containing protein [Tanacetum coccineum]|uniref:Reverse transcriptase domain-containing protein n=1 Tax=Tanacetum coccineum TaxID=301880 RepID=A0ABQ4XF70_9ASTR